MKKTVSKVGVAITALSLSASLVACSSSGTGSTGSTSATGSSAKQLVFGYVSPGPDTWYKRDVEGFKYAADKYGVQVVELNSQYDQQKELQNIQSLVGKGVDGISMFSFNNNGALMAAQAGQKAGIPVVLTDNVGNAMANGAKVAASVDFNWCGMGKSFAQEMADKWPGQNFAMIAGNQAPPAKTMDDCMIAEAGRLGKNKNVFLQLTDYNTQTAVNQAQSLIASGTQFGILFVANDDMGAAVAQVLKSKGLSDKVHLMTENGSDVGIKMLKDGQLAYTISSSPGWEGSVAFLALYAAATGKLPADGNKQLMLPVMPIDASSPLDNKSLVVPWAPDPVYWDLNVKDFPALVPSSK